MFAFVYTPPLNALVYILVFTVSQVPKKTENWRNKVWCSTYDADFISYPIRRYLKWYKKSWFQTIYFLKNADKKVYVLTNTKNNLESFCFSLFTLISTRMCISTNLRSVCKCRICTWSLIGKCCTFLIAFILLLFNFDLRQASSNLIQGCYVLLYLI